jgi:PAS domain S-box-containing protein
MLAILGDPPRIGRVPTGVANELIQVSLLGEAIDPGPVAVFVADDDRRYLAVNRYACDLLGYTREELLELSVLDVAVNPGADEDFEKMRASGSRNGTARLRHRDGSELEIAYRASETTVGSLRLYVSACWRLEES